MKISKFIVTVKDPAPIM